MKRILIILFAVILIAGCVSDPVPSWDVDSEWNLDVKINDMKGMDQSLTKVSYGGTNGVHTEFEVGDYFGLFVFGDENETSLVSNVKVFCSGFDNKGGNVWSIYKAGESQGNSSNSPLSEILARGTGYFAYYPYNPDLDTPKSKSELESYVNDFIGNLPKDQSSSFKEYDLMVASNITGCEYGEVTIQGREVSLLFNHTLAMLKFNLPSGSKKYSYLFSGEDFTPSITSASGGHDECRYLFKAGCHLKFCVKYLHGGKLYKFETGNLLNLWPITTEAGHCYYHDENATRVPYNNAVDMGTSVMWASFNIGAENEFSATSENIGQLKGSILMWGVNQVTEAVGPKAFQNYNKSFTAGTKPSELPEGYNYSGDIRYDAATNLWGGKWRTPTQAEWKELFSACTWTVSNNIITFTSKTTGNSITMAYAGYDNGSGTQQKTSGYYWSSVSSATASTGAVKAVATSFSSSGVNTGMNPNADRYTGLPIRPVYSE